MDLQRCPSHEDLIGFLAEQLDDAQTHQVEAHLESCARCCAILDTLLAEEAVLPSPNPAPSSGWEPDDTFLQQLQKELASQDDPPRTDPAEQPADFPVEQLFDPAPDPSTGDGKSATRNIRQPAPLGPLGRLGSYRLQAVVGRGGMGVVLRAFDETLQRVVAIKVLAPHLAANGAARKRFVREARATAAVSHDHVVTIHAVEDKGPVPYLVMPFVAGESLQNKLERTGPLGVAEVLRIGLQIAEGLAAAHKQGLVHRDIKPANILLENGVERVKIVDFGLAQVANDARLTESGHLAGTPEYMSPEQAAGQAIDPRSDLFSLGSVLYALCTGRPPFRAAAALAVLKRVCEETPRPIREINPDIPQPVCRIIDRLLAKDPAQRFQTAAEAAQQLNQILAQLQAAGRDLPGPAGASPRRRRIGKTLAAGLAALVLVGAGISAVCFLGRPAGQRHEPGAPATGEHLPTEPGAAAGSSFPLLPLLDVTRDSVGSEWRRTDGILTSPGEPGPHMLQLPYCPPAEYNLSLRAERKSGKDALYLGLVVSGRQVLVVLDGWGGGISGLSLIDGKPGSLNDSRFDGPLLPPGMPCRIDCSIRPNHVSVAVEGLRRIDWHGEPAALSVFQSFRVPNPDCLFLGSQSTSFAVTDLSVRPISAGGWRFSDKALVSPVRVAVEQILWKNAYRLVLVPKGGPPIEVGRLADLPGSDFQITTLLARPDASGDRIAALLPDRVGLRRLELDHTALTDEGIGPLSHLTGLEELSVVDTLLEDSDLVKLAGFRGLKRLRVGWDQFSAEALRQFARRLPGCQVQQLSPHQTAARMCLAFGGSVRVLARDGAIRALEKLADLPEVEEFRLVGFNLREPMVFVPQHSRCLRNLPELRFFVSWYNGIDDDGVRHWKDLPRLEVVQLGTCRLTAAGLEHLSGFSTIRQLNLNYSTCDDAGLVQVAKLARLETLDLWQTPVTDASVEPLSKLKQLKNLDLRVTKITPAGVERLRQALPQCRIAYP